MIDIISQVPIITWHNYYVNVCLLLYTGKFLRHFIFTNFANFAQSQKLNVAKYYNATPFMLLTWIIRENIFHEIIKIAIFVKI